MRFLYFNSCRCWRCFEASSRHNPLYLYVQHNNTYKLNHLFIHAAAAADDDDDDEGDGGRLILLQKVKR